MDAKNVGVMTPLAGSPSSRQKGGKIRPMASPKPVIQTARSANTRVVRRGIVGGS